MTVDPNAIFVRDGTVWTSAGVTTGIDMALAMVEEGYVTSLSGKRVPVAADTLCLHGDQPGAAKFAAALRNAFKEKGIPVAAP